MTMEATTPRPLSARKRSRSVPRGTNYYAHTDAAHSRTSRPVDDNMAFTVYDGQISCGALISILRSEPVKHNLDVSDMVLERFGQILPNTDASREQMMILRMVLVLPMQVSNVELEKILRLDVPGRKRNSQQGRKSREHAFYIRSWTMTPMQLHNISRCLQEDGLAFDALNEWKYISYLAKDRPVTVRYIGSTNCLTTASRRFTDDTNNKSKSSLLGAFQGCLEELYPTLAQEAKIHLLPDMSFEILGSGNHIGNQLNSDDTETLLIHLLGCRSLLNLQFGGQHIRYLPNEEDELTFERLHTTYFHKILCNGSRLPESQWSSVKNHFDSILARILKTKGDLCESAKNALQDQAIPPQYLGLTIVVFVGEEPTDGHLKAGCSFFEGNS